MASDRSPLSKRLRTLAKWTGIPASEERDAPSGPAVPVPPAQPAPPRFAVPAAAPDDAADEQPTGDVPVVEEQPTDDVPAVAAPAEHPVPEPAPPAAPSGPTLRPPVIPAATPEPEPAAQPTTAAEPESEEDDEPFSGRGAIWPQSSPTPRFEPQPSTEPAPSGEPQPPAEPTPSPIDAPTFPEPSPTPIEDDAPAESERASAAAAALPSATGLDAPNGPTDATVEPSSLVPSAASSSRTGAFGKLRRLRGGRSAETPASTPSAPAKAVAASAVATSATAGTIAPAPEPEAAPPAPAPESRELPLPPLEASEKPSFTERATLRRRAKTLRARRDAGLLELGAIVLDQRRFGDPTGGALMRRRTDELADLDSELAAIEQVLDDDGPAETVAQLGVVRCLTCTSLVGPRDRFCVHCGAPRPEEANPPAGGA